jgi:beta-aspartyl-peptidase (threonine type)
VHFVSRVAPAIAVHGGAGRIRDGLLQERLDACRDAALRGWRLLAEGGVALDAVQIAVQALEDHPLFNAGVGAALNAAGEIQLDASIMDGATLRSGAVGAAPRIRNPVQLARRLLDEGRHVLLVGEGAWLYARAEGVPTCEMEELVVPAQRRRWQEGHGTVGCVALDRAGYSAAATSTGGLSGALPGRVGDSALIGCGTYAAEEGAASCTGLGEAIIRVGLARTAIELLRAGLQAEAAASQALSAFRSQASRSAGLIIVDRRGRSGYAKNTEHMPVCLITEGGEPVLAI